MVPTPLAQVRRVTRYECYFVGSYHAEGTLDTAVGRFSETWNGSVWLSDSDDEASEEEPYRREKITPREFQWALGGPDVMADATLRRYMRGLMPHPRGDRRNLWDPAIEPSELPDCIERPSPRKTWIRIDRLDLSRYPVAVIERLKYLQTLGEDEVFAREMAAA